MPLVGVLGEENPPVGVQEEDRFGAQGQRASILGPPGDGDQQRKTFEEEAGENDEGNAATQRRDGSGENRSSSGIGRSWSRR